MRIVVVSDTHSPHFARRLPEALERIAAARPERILHCGDFTSEDIVPAFERIAPLEAVAGNNDGEGLVRRFGRRAIVTAGPWRFGLVHGDGARGTSRGRARAAFAGEAVDAILFGHSHIPLCERGDDGVWLLNPGSPTDKRRQPRYSFGVIETNGAGLVLRLEFFGP